MIKKLLILGAFCSFSFGGIEDDINKNGQIQKEIQEINEYINLADLQCKALNIEKIDWEDQKKLSLGQIENYYNGASSAVHNIEVLNKQFKEKITKFYSLYHDDKAFNKIVHHLKDINYLQHELNFKSYKTKKEVHGEICNNIKDIDKYKTSIQTLYQYAKAYQKRDEIETEIEQIIKSEKYDNGKINDNLTIEDYDKYLENAHSLYEKLRYLFEKLKQLNNSNMLSQEYQYTQEAEEEYINQLKDSRQHKIADIESEARSKQRDKEYAEKAKQNDKVKKALIPKYKNWKNITVPKFQKSLKAGDYVAGGIVWKVDGNLVVVDTGNKGLMSQRRDQTYPRVPQDLMPLFMDEITGVARY